MASQVVSSTVGKHRVQSAAGKSSQLPPCRFKPFSFFLLRISKLQAWRRWGWRFSGRSSPGALLCGCWIDHGSSRFERARRRWWRVRALQALRQDEQRSLDSVQTELRAGQAEFRAGQAELRSLLLSLNTETALVKGKQ
ncbi:hypothetical protein ABPG77_008784 [Micractinium sp. CCAP 211/92]